MRGGLTNEVLDSTDDSQDFITTYTMDLVSNRLIKQTDNAATAQAIADFVTLGSMTADEVVTYGGACPDYIGNANDRMQWEKKDAAGTAEDTYTAYLYEWNGRDTGDLMEKSLNPGLTVGTPTETTTFEYNVQGRTGKITVTKAGGTTEITYKGTCPDYIGNQQGIRVEEATTAGGVTTTKSYLIDQANFTGYAQVLEEYVDGQLAKTFTLGHDLLTQASTDADASVPSWLRASVPLTLIYDGHGSTRALLDSAAAVIQRYAGSTTGTQLVRPLPLHSRRAGGWAPCVVERRETGSSEWFSSFGAGKQPWERMVIPHRACMIRAPSVPHLWQRSLPASAGRYPGIIRAPLCPICGKEPSLESAGRYACMIRAHRCPICGKDPSLESASTRVHQGVRAG